MFRIDAAQCVLMTLFEHPAAAFLYSRHSPGSGGALLVLIAGFGFWKLAVYERRRGWPWFVAAVVPSLVMPYPRVWVFGWSVVLFIVMWAMNVREGKR